MFSDVVIILPDIIVHDPNFLQYTLFGAVRDMCKVKPFRLVFWLGKFPGDSEYDRGRLKEMIGVQAAGGGFRPLPHPPVIVSYTRVAESPRAIEHLLECGTR